MSRMLEEIRQQPEALERTLSAELRERRKIQKLVSSERRPRLIVLVARGTRDNAALFGRYLLEITTGIPVSLAAPSIATLYQARIDYRDALVVAHFAIRRIHRHQSRARTRPRAGRAHPGHHQRKLQRHGAPRRARLPGPRRTRKERRRHQDLHRPDAHAVSARLRPGRRRQHRRPGADARRSSAARSDSSRKSTPSPNATASCATP